MFIGRLVLSSNIYVLFKLLEEASALLKIDMDKRLISGFSKLSNQIVSIAPHSNLKSLCLQSVEESQTDAERNGKPYKP